jgi:hypothetical protein
MQFFNRTRMDGTMDIASKLSGLARLGTMVVLNFLQERLPTVVAV